MTTLRFIRRSLVGITFPVVLLFSLHAADTTPADPRGHWAFQPVRKPALPDVRQPGAIATPVDAFILAKLEERQWQPAAPASREQLIRRVCFDLTGLPPTPEEIAAFVNDPAPDAYERVVDRLLNSPRYGEHWGQHWLDVVRYAETEGYEYDRHVPDAWRFRDYVMRSLNDDKPFDRFVIEQIAGDELAGSTTSLDPPTTELLAASIFHRLGPVRRNAGNPDIALSRNEVLTERTDIIGAGFLGLTVGCARCHDHKLEPISQRDYYRLQAYLATTEEHNIVLATKEQQAAWEASAKDVKDRIQTLREQQETASDEEKTRLGMELETLEDQLPAPLPTIPSTIDDFEKRTAIHVLKRGDWEVKGEAVGPRPPEVLVDTKWPELAADIAQPRLHLARWLVDSKNPLTARVIVNRLWQHHFGTGLVKTVNDLGTHGGAPSHPELLDWLAAMLVENGWRLKPMHRLMVLSNAYRQSSRSLYATDWELVDPENRLLWRFNRRRLSAEEIRDTMLAAAGRLNLREGGASVMVPVDEEMVKLLYKPSQWQVTGDATEHDRRSIYLIAKRNLRLPFMETFDAPALQTSCARRETSTHAPQALEMLNGRLSNELAGSFARRLERETGGEVEQVVERACQLAFGRGPTPEEREIALTYLRDGSVKEFALAMFNLNAFLYVE